MEVRSCRLPPLPNKKSSPLRPENRLLQKFQKQHRNRNYSRQRQQTTETNQNSSQDRYRNRPTSVHSVSRQSIASRDSKNSRGSSRQKSVEYERKERANYNVKTRITMPSVSAKSWAVYEMKQAKLIYGKRMFKKRQIASLTKMMNFITILELIQENHLDATKIMVKVSRDASCIIGTTAQLKHDLQISLYDLYYGMMLPSGNDAAYQIAQIGGALILMMKNMGELKKEIIYSIDLFSEYYLKLYGPVKTYLAQMNKVSKKIGMQNSNFANPHGLSNTENYSCAQDLCKLGTYCMENQTFRTVVLRKNYQKSYKIHQIFLHEEDLVLGSGEDQLQQKSYSQQIQNTSDFQQIQFPFAKTIGNIIFKWQNTNKMLKEGWSGIKTGITPNAGPCLAASVQRVVTGRNLQFLVILINSSSMQARWKEVRELVEWVISQKMCF